MYGKRERRGKYQNMKIKRKEWEGRRRKGNCEMGEDERKKDRGRREREGGEENR